MAISFLLGDFVLGIGQNVFVWAIGAFAAQIFIPPLVSANMAIWQSKIPLDQQGRVLAARESFVTAPFAIGFLIAGPLADRLDALAVRKVPSRRVMSAKSTVDRVIRSSA